VHHSRLYAYIAHDPTASRSRSTASSLALGSRRPPQVALLGDLSVPRGDHEVVRGGVLGLQLPGRQDLAGLGDKGTYSFSSFGLRRLDRVRDLLLLIEEVRPLQRPDLAQAPCTCMSAKKSAWRCQWFRPTSASSTASFAPVRQKRWVVERTISWLHQHHRRLRIRYDRRADVHQAFLQIAGCLICVKLLTAEERSTHWT
jgi:hypothetical protein